VEQTALNHVIGDTGSRQGAVVQPFVNGDLFDRRPIEEISRGAGRPDAAAQADGGKFINQVGAVYVGTDRFCGARRPGI
jgi:hypothetical protein